MQSIDDLIRYYQHKIDRAKEDIKKLRAIKEERSWERPLTVDELITWQDMIARNDRHIEIFSSTIKYLEEVKNVRQTESL